MSFICFVQFALFLINFDALFWTNRCYLRKWNQLIYCTILVLRGKSVFELKLQIFLCVTCSCSVIVRMLQPECFMKPWCITWFIQKVYFLWSHYWPTEHTFSNDTRDLCSIRSMFIVLWFIGMSNLGINANHCCHGRSQHLM